LTDVELILVAGGALAARANYVVVVFLIVFRFIVMRKAFGGVLEVTMPVKMN
jgi:hypothetical protein